MNLSNQGLRILVVDDSPLSRKLLEYALTDKSYSVVFAKDGREAIGLFGKRPADMVISDWVLPDISGPDLCRKIRAEFPDAYTYLVLLTSNSDNASVAEGLAAGADDYVTKPFDREALVARVGLGRRVIEMHREIEAKTKRLLVETRTNPLTGLPNRRAVEEWTIKQLAGATRHGYDPWVVLADLESHHQVTTCSGDPPETL